MEEGMEISAALEQSQLLPPAQCRLLQLGFRSGKGDKVMQAVADTLMEQAIAKLFREGMISRETALHHADKPEQLQRLMG